MGFLLLLLLLLLLAAALFVIFNWKPAGAVETRVTAQGKDAARKMYRWLRLSSFLTVPSFIFLLIFIEIAIPSRYEFEFRILAAMLPFVWHLAFLGHLGDKRLFVFRHAQQALAFLSLRVASAVIAAVNVDDGGLVFFFVFNGMLWFFGSWWGNRQLKRNTCWLMMRKKEGIYLVGEASAAKIICSSCGKPLAGTDVFCPYCGHAFAVPKSALAETYLDEGLRLFVEENNKEAATKKLLRAFQAGTPDIRQRAVEALSKLGEVEKF